QFAPDLRVADGAYELGVETLLAVPATLLLELVEVLEDDVRILALAPARAGPALDGVPIAVGTCAGTAAGTGSRTVPGALSGIPGGRRLVRIGRLVLRTGRRGNLDFGSPGCVSQRWRPGELG
ncbi:MAG: hypothetical protein ACYSWX_16285, partial [Planctomycetota bacterium]